MSELKTDLVLLSSILIKRKFLMVRPAGLKFLQVHYIISAIKISRNTVKLLHDYTISYVDKSD